MKCWIIFLSLIPCIAFSQTDDSVFIRRIADEVLVNGKAYEQLRYLTKKIGGRLAGSPQMVLAENWGAKTLRELHADTVYMQELMVPHWVRGGQDKASIISINGKKQNRVLDVVALGNSLGSKKPVTAQVLAVSSYDELEARKDEVKGKIVFYNAAFDPRNINTGRSYGQTGLYRRNGASRAAKYGAVGVLTRSLSEGENNHPHTGAMVYNDSFPKIPAAALGLYDADFLWKTCKENKAVTVTMQTHGYFLPDTIGHNVIAEIRGSIPNEYITVGGHLDSWDVAEGAHDDGTGIVQTMEILRTFRALNYKPQRTIRFVLFANEENGSRGGDKYATMAKEKSEKHVLAMESDGGGFTPRAFGFTGTAAQLQKLQAWTSLLWPYGVYEVTRGGGGTDIGPLYRMMQTPLAGLDVDDQRYFDLHHARNDVFEAVNKRELFLGAINMAALIYLVDKYGL